MTILLLIFLSEKYSRGYDVECNIKVSIISLNGNWKCDNRIKDFPRLRH